MLLIEKVKKAALNQQVTSFLKILSLSGPQSPLVAKTLFLLVYKKSESLKVDLRRRLKKATLLGHSRVVTQLTTAPSHLPLEPMLGL